MFLLVRISLPLPDGGGICLHKIEITKRAIDKFIIYLNDIQSQRFTQQHQDEINKLVNKW